LEIGLLSHQLSHGLDLHFRMSRLFMGFQQLVDIRPHHHALDFADTLYRAGSLYDV